MSTSTTGTGPYAMATDLDLLKRYAADGDARAFAQVATRHRDMVFATCYRVLGNDADAEDAAQDCFMALARSAGRVSASVAGWLHRVATRTARTLRKRQQALRDREHAAAELALASDDSGLWEEVRPHVDQAIDRLPDQLRVPLVLYYLDGCDQATIAGDLGVSQAAVSRRLSKAVEQVRDLLRKSGVLAGATALTAFLKTETSHAAPASLATGLGKLAVSGVGSGGATAVSGGSSLAWVWTALGMWQVQIGAVVAVALVGGFVVHSYTTHRRTPVGPSVMASSLSPKSLARRDEVESAPATSVPEKPQHRDGPSEAKDDAGGAVARDDAGAETTRRANRTGEAANTPATAQPPEPTRKSGQSNRDHANNAPQDPQPATGLATIAVAASEQPQVGEAAPRVAPTSSVRVAQAAADLQQATKPRVGRLLEYDGERVTIGGRVDLYTTRDADAELALAAGAICSTAAEVFAEELGLKGPEVVDVCVSVATSGWPRVVTDRNTSVYLTHRGPLIGEDMGRHLQAVGILCKAVAELYNPHRVPGLERYVTACFAVPAVWDALGEDAWPRRYPYEEAEGTDAFIAKCTDPLFFTDHPDWSAAGALWETADALGTAWLARQFNALEVEGAEALQEIQEAAVAADGGLAGAFDMWEQATSIEVDADGSLLITSFETPEQVAMMFRLPYQAENLGAQLTSSTDWSTDGERCGVFQFQTGQWPAVAVFDADWRYKDWSQFATLEFDVHNPSSAEAPLVCEARDAPDRGHGYMLARFTIPPGEEQHCVLTVNPAERDVVWMPRDAPYWEGQSRLSEIAKFVLSLNQPKVLPLTLWIDNIRLRP